jgi:hypothetical protein
MSDVTRNGVFLARASLAGIGRFCSTCLSEPVQPRKADGGSQSLLVYWASREANLIQRQNAFFPSRERIY